MIFGSIKLIMWNNGASMNMPKQTRKTSTRSRPKSGGCGRDVIITTHSRRRDGSTSRHNLCQQVLRMQQSGRGVRLHHMPKPILERINSKFGFMNVPQIIRELDDCISSSTFTRDIFKVIEWLKELNALRTAEYPGDQRGGSSNDNTSTVADPFVEAPSTNVNGAIFQVMNIFGGVEVILRILFHPIIRGNCIEGSKTYSTFPILGLGDVQNKVRSLSLEIIHDVCLNDESVACCIGKKDEVIEYLFSMMEDKQLFSAASAVLEDLLASNRKIVDLARVGNLAKLITGLKETSFTSFCRILSVVIADIDFTSEDKFTLVAQDKEETDRAAEKSRADSNQALLLAYPDFLSRMVKLASRPLAYPPSLPPANAGASPLETLLWNSGSTAQVAEILDMFGNEEAPMDTSSTEGSSGSTDFSFGNMSVASMIPLRLKQIHEVMHKVEMLYVLTLFLSGKYKSEVQSKLSDLRLIPSLCDMFERLGWRNSNDRFPRHNHSESEDCDCTPESALKIQFLRFVHSFCDHNVKKHIMLSSKETGEVHSICEKYELEKPVGLQVKGKYRCRGEKGLLTKIVDVLKSTAPNNALRFWLSRAIEGFLRGRVSPPDQHFLINRDLVEHLLEHVLDPETKAKEILQSSFDLLGELMKFNEIAFQRFNNFITSDKQFESFVSTMTSNVVDSNMFIRCIVLSLERFSASKPYPESRQTHCRLSDLVRRWEHKMYLMYKLITSISVDNLTQENVSCLNTTLIFLMFAHNHNQLGQYLQAFVSEEQAQKHPGLILSNLRDLLEFWRVHYLRRGKDCSQLEQSSCISFDHWQNVVDVLLHEDSSCPTSIRHYLSPRQQQAPSRIRAELVHRDC